MDAPDSVEVGAVEPGEEVEVTVKMKAPADAGRYTGVWQMKTAQGFFGGQFTVVIRAGEVAGTISGSFELGGQTHTLAHPNEMHYAGMNWKVPGKVVARYDGRRRRGADSASARERPQSLVEHPRRRRVPQEH
jgi:hypothetical protein